MIPKECFTSLDNKRVLSFGDSDSRDCKNSSKSSSSPYLTDANHQPIKCIVTSEKSPMKDRNTSRKQ
jgi:hypothetical protein